MTTQTDDEDRPWRWRNLRSCSVLFAVFPCPWNWHVRVQHDADCYDWRTSIQIGPVAIILVADIGNVSAEGWRGWFGLSMAEAWERSAPKGARGEKGDA